MAYALTIFVGTVLAGGVSLWVLGDGEYSIGEAVYFALVTSASVGFAEMPNMDHHGAMRIVTSALIVTGVGTLAFFQSTLTALFVDDVIGSTLRRRRMEKKIDALSNHFVVAGCGQTGRYIVEELAAVGRNFVVIDRDGEALRRLSEELAAPFLYVTGDATDDHILGQAHVARARGIMAALSEDRDNLFVVLSARVLNPKARIVSKVVDIENEAKLRKAGADQVVSMHRMGGLRMASELVRPRVTNFLDGMLRVPKTIRFDEIRLPPTSRYVGKSLREIPIRQETDLLVVALHDPDDAFVYNPSPDRPIPAETELIVMGDVVEIDKLRDLLNRT